MSLVPLAHKYSEAGYSVIPVGTNKIPTIREWKTFQERPMTTKEVDRHFKNAYGVALLMTQGLTAIDLDLKYDLSGDIEKRYKERLPPEILRKLYVQRTQSGGYHWVFRCTKQEPNQKLASRFTTADEKHRTYMENYENPLTRDRALKIAQNDLSRVIFETRGTGGYILINPTLGYTHVYGKLTDIQESEYDILIETAREFNEISKIPKTDSRQSIHDSDWEVSPFLDYNQRGDLLYLLQANGWEIVGSRSNKNIRLKRPGKSSTSSALYDTSTHVFNCFSTSTLFDPTRGYSPTDVFIELECNGDTGLAYKKLIESGYGIKK